MSNKNPEPKNKKQEKRKGREYKSAARPDPKTNPPLELYIPVDNGDKTEQEKPKE
jgi:hypothetical protein